MSRIFKALGDPSRRHILELLKGGPLTAGEIATHFDVSKPTLSAHFTVLKEAGLIEAERSGKNIRYHLCLSVLEDAILVLAQQVGLTTERWGGAVPTAISRKEQP